MMLLQIKFLLYLLNIIFLLFPLIQVIILNDGFLFHLLTFLLILLFEEFVCLLLIRYLYIHCKNLLFCYFHFGKLTFLYLTFLHIHLFFLLRIQILLLELSLFHIGSLLYLRFLYVFLLYECCLMSFDFCCNLFGNCFFY